MVGGVFSDLKDAFDRLHHDILIRKNFSILNNVMLICGFVQILSII